LGSPTCNAPGPNVASINHRTIKKPTSRWGGGEDEDEDEEEFCNHYKNDLERHAHTPSGVAGADLNSQAGGAKDSHPLTAQPLYDVHDTPTNLELPRAGRNSPGATSGLVTDPRLQLCRMRIRKLASSTRHDACPPSAVGPREVLTAGAV